MGKALRVFILKMFLGRVYRQKKRKLLLLAVQTPPEASSMSLWRPPIRHVPSRERDWVEATFRAHAAFCGCANPVIHFTSVLARFNLQGGPQTPPDDPPEGAPVLRALPAPSPRRRHTASENPGSQPWPTGGAAGGGRGDGDGGAADAADEYRPEDIDDLFAAIERDTQ